MILRVIPYSFPIPLRDVVYQYCLDIEYVDSSLDLKSFLRPKANRTPDEAFGLFDLPPELQLLILREVSVLLAGLF